MLKTYLLFTALQSCFVFFNCEKEKNFGSFNLTVRDVTVCHGPKQKECATVAITVNGYSHLKYDLRVFKNTAPTKGKIIAQKSGVDIMRFQMKKPCDHMFFRPLFQSVMNLTKDCEVIKGHYVFEVDTQKVAQNYWGGNFLFGNWTFKTVFYNDECNFYCSVIDAILFPNKV